MNRQWPSGNRFSALPILAFVTLRLNRLRKNVKRVCLPTSLQNAFHGRSNNNCTKRDGAIFTCFTGNPCSSNVRVKKYGTFDQVLGLRESPMVNTTKPGWRDALVLLIIVASKTHFAPSSLWYRRMELPYRGRC